MFTDVVFLNREYMRSLLFHYYVDGMAYSEEKQAMLSGACIADSQSVRFEKDDLAEGIANKLLDWSVMRRRMTVLSGGANFVGARNRVSVYSSAMISQLI